MEQMNIPWSTYQHYRAKIQSILHAVDKPIMQAQILQDPSIPPSDINYARATLLMMKRDGEVVRQCNGKFRIGKSMGGLR